MPVVLSKDVLDRLQDAQCAMPNGTFCYSTDDVQSKKRAVFLHECKLLLAHGQAFADPSKKLNEACNILISSSL